MKEKPYVPDLTEMASICEANYLRLYKLLPNMDEGVGRDFNLKGGPHLSTRISFSIEEQFAYTRTILVQQESALSGFIAPPKMEVPWGLSLPQSQNANARRETANKSILKWMAQSLFRARRSWY